MPILRASIIASNNNLYICFKGMIVEKINALKYDFHLDLSVSLIFDTS